MTTPQESTEYLKGKIAGLESLSFAFVGVVARDIATLPGATDLRIRLANQIRSVVDEEFSGRRIGGTPFGHGITDAILDFSAKLLDK